MFNRIAFRSAIPFTFTLREEIVGLKNDSEDDLFWKFFKVWFKKSYVSVPAKKCVFLKFLEVNHIAAVEQMFVNICTQMKKCKLKTTFFECNAFRLAFPIFLATATTTDFCKKCRKQFFEYTPWAHFLK